MARNKTKKSTKNDFIRSSLGAFLKQKNYAASDKFRKTTFQHSHSKRQFLFNKIIENDLSKRNSFTFSNVVVLSNNHTIVDQQFAKLTKFIEIQIDPIKKELHKCIAPLLCHLYLELLKGHEVKAATAFLKKYAHLVAPVESYEEVTDESPPSSISLNPQIRFAQLKANADFEQSYFVNIIQILSTCLKLEAAECCNDIITFRSSKYEIHMSDAAVKVLNSFLQKQGHVLILKLIYTWIHLYIDDIQANDWSERSLLFPDENCENDEFTIVEDDCQTADSKQSPDKCIEGKRGQEKSLQKLLDICMNELRQVSFEMRSWPDTPRLIQLRESSSYLVAADMDSDECHLAAGLTNGEVKLWQLNHINTSGYNFYSKFNDRKCPWEINNISIDANEDEEETKYESILRDKSSFQFYEHNYKENMLSDYGGFVLRGHNRGVTDVRFSKHFPILISVSKDKTMRSWRSDSFVCSSIYRGHNYPIWCFDESPVKMYAATGSRDLTARLWSLDRTSPLITYVGHTQDVDCVQFHPNGNYIATGSCDLSIRLWCVTSGKLVRVFSDCKLPITSIAFSCDGKLLAAAGEETKIRIFDLAGGSQMTEIKDQSSTVTSMQWSPSGLLATSARDGILRVWDISKLSSGNTFYQIKTLDSGWKRMVKVCFGSSEILTAVGS